MNEAHEEMTSDVSAMMDLFRSEVKRHGSTINDGLQSLKANPENLERFQVMIPAIQAIKGGAQIVELDQAVAVAQLMKSLFAAAEKGELPLSETDLQYLFEGVEILNHMAEGPAEGEPPWIESNAEKIAEWLRGAGSRVSVDPPVKTAAVDAVSEMAPEIAFVPVEEASPSDVARDVPSDDDASEIDPAMCELFRTETQNQVAILNDGLLTLEQRPASGDQLEAMMQAAHSLKGAARIVGVDGAAHIAGAMEDCFAAAQKGLISLYSDKADLLFQGIDMLNRISEHVGEGGSRWAQQ